MAGVALAIEASDGGLARHARKLRTDPLLRKWIAEEHLDPRPLRASLLARPFSKWAVADDFFRPERIAEMERHCDSLQFEQDDVGLNYDSMAVRLDRAENQPLLAFFASPSWWRYAAFVTGSTLTERRTVLKFRKHPAHSHGFWPHTDRDTEGRKALAVLGYFNRNWTARDGGLLQFWRVQELSPGPECPILRWDEFVGRELAFLKENTTLNIEIVGERGGLLAHTELLDQILPQFNRVVFISFQRAQSFHSVTPCGDRVRKGFLQWIY